MIKFRNEHFYGNAGHTPAEILTYECVNLGNMYILEELASKAKPFLSKIELADINWLIEACEKSYVETNNEALDYTSYLPIFKSLVKALEKVWDMKINYLIWLADLEDVLEHYSDEFSDYLEEVDAYETGRLVFEIPCDGNLYAYETEPKPLSKENVKKALDETSLYQVHVYPNVGYELQTLYFNHSTITLEELVAKCVLTNKGYWLTSWNEDIEKDERFVHVDLSNYVLRNVMFSLDNLKLGDNVELI